MFRRVFALPDRWLNTVTMYRLVIYYLSGLLGVAFLFTLTGRLDYSPVSLVGTALGAVVTALAVNALFAKTFGAPVNSDSALITGLILALIVGPAQTTDEYVFLIWASTLAIASKFIIARHRVHLFNPAAIAVVLTGYFAAETASWWVATYAMTPFVVIGGFFLVRKLKRNDLVTTFLWSTFFITLAWSAFDGLDWQQALRQGVMESPAWFLAFVMLTEPVTMPPTKKLQMLYGLLTGILVVPQLHISTFYFTPEIALVIANAVTLPLRSREKRELVLERAYSIGPGLVDFVYRLTPPLAFQPGQYMEWTLDHDRADNRGKRRYFTLASSPTETTLRIGVKFSEEGSSFKKEMEAHVRDRKPIIASIVSGDFTLPANREKKLAFIAGGIGVTPFRSMVKYITDRRENRDVVMLYSNSRHEEIAYTDVFSRAQRDYWFRPVYVLTDQSAVPPGWQDEKGRIDAAMIRRQIPDYRDRIFYVSGSPGLVESVHKTLSELGVSTDNIRTDHFTGLAA